MFVGAGDLYWSDDPIVKGREGLFGDVQVRETKSRRKPAAPSSPDGDETADQAPGRRRTTTRRPEPKDETPDKAADKPAADTVGIRTTDLPKGKG